jgi:DNA ligase-1
MIRLFPKIHRGLKKNFSFCRVFSFSLNPANARGKPSDSWEKNKEKEILKKEAKKACNKAYKLKNADRKEEKKAYMKAYNLKNAETLREKRRAYTSTPMKKEERRKYRLKNRVRINELNRKYYRKNIETSRNYYTKNKGTIIKKLTQKIKETNPTYVRKSPKYSWSTRESVVKFFEEVAKILGITDLSSWYGVTGNQIRKAGGASLYGRFPTLGEALSFAYPEEKWNLKSFSCRNKQEAQGELVDAVKKLLPNTTVFVNYRKGADMKYNEDSKRTFELDIFVPEKKIAIEYQGEQHFQDFSHAGYISLAERQKKDKKKMEVCTKLGIGFIEIPYWWDRTLESLSATLNLKFPDVFEKIGSGIPIPTEAPPKKEPIRTNKNIMQGYDYKEDSKINVEGWFMSEKIDGMRAYFDGKQFWSKNGNKINVPDSFIKFFPNFPLDCELWGGYDRIDETNFELKQACRKKGSYKMHWENYILSVFDAPHVQGSYDKRHAYLVDNFSQYCNSSIHLLPMEICRGKDHLQQRLEEVVKKGGEGIIIHDPQLHYHPGRTNKLLKVKEHFDSIVIFQHLKPRARTFICKQLENDVICEVRCSAGSRRTPPQPGTKIHITHQGLFNRSQKYRHPVLVKIEESDQPQTNKKIKQPKKNNNKTNKNIE